MIPDDLPDLPALQQIAEALWSRNAAVMVGAGFSRNCVLPSPITPPPPLWNDLAKPMAAKLYGETQTPPADPLRLAEEFRTFFGQAALNDLVRHHIRDDAWTPGEAHRGLLDLPWSDVLTTNYDTLLERAALEIDGRVYDVVHREADLAHARAPRIVKLHGTVGGGEGFILTEDDYRTYPARHAAFVNFARQAFLENELCLLGFSGDDPNFLQWSGWVRDHLGSSARRIYLVGVLDLSPAKRRYLEARNIAPVDFHPLVEKLPGRDQHGAAARMLLDYLNAARTKPLHEWKPANLIPEAQDHEAFRDSALAASLYRKALPLWREDRENYPGWLVAPKAVREAIERSSHVPPFPREKTLADLSHKERAQVLFELAWRQQISFAFVDKWLAALMAEYADPASSPLEPSAALVLATAVLASAGTYRDWEAFEKWAAVIEAHAKVGDDHSAFLNHQRALRARDGLDFETLERLVPTIVGTDPAWALRRAALWADLDRSVDAGREVDAALEGLRQRLRLDRRSIWLSSRLAWAYWWRRALARGGLREWNDPMPDDVSGPRADLGICLMMSVTMSAARSRSSARS